jgi:hypothetical protein
MSEVLLKIVLQGYAPQKQVGKSKRCVTLKGQHVQVREWFCIVGQHWEAKLTSANHQVSFPSMNAENWKDL